MRILGTYSTAFGTTLSINIFGSGIAVENLSNYVLKCSLPPAQYFYVGPQQGRAANLPGTGFSGQLTVEPIDPTGTIGTGTAVWYINEYDGSDQIPITPWSVISKNITVLPTSNLPHTKIWTDWPYVYGSLQPNSPPRAGSPPPFVAIKNFCLSLSPNMSSPYAVLGAMTFAGFPHYLIPTALLQPYDCVFGLPLNNNFGLLAINNTGAAGLASADSGGTLIVQSITITDWYITFWNPLSSWPAGLTTTPTLNWQLVTGGAPLNYAANQATSTTNNFFINSEILYYTGH